MTDVGGASGVLESIRVSKEGFVSCTSSDSCSFGRGTLEAEIIKCYCLMLVYISSASGLRDAYPVLDERPLLLQPLHHTPGDIDNIADPVRLPRGYDDMRAVLVHSTPHVGAVIDSDLVERPAVARTRIAVFDAVFVGVRDGREEVVLRNRCVLACHATEEGGERHLVLSR